MFKILLYIKKNLTIILPITMILAIIFGYYFNAAPLKQLLTFITFLMVYPMMVPLQFKQLFTKGNTKLHIVTQLINFIMIPLLSFILGKLFFSSNSYIMTGLLLISLLPTSGMTISWTGFARGNVPAAIKMMITGLILGSLSIPIYLNLFMGKSINIPFISVFNQIIKIVFIPMIAGYLTQKVLIKKYGEELYSKKYKPKFPLISTIWLLGIVFISSSLKSKTIINNPALLLKILVVLIIYYIVNFTLSTLIAKSLFSKEDSIALIYGTVMRNLSIALAIAISLLGTKGSDVTLIIAVAFIVQIQGAAWYLKFSEKFLRT